MTVTITTMKVQQQQQHYDTSIDEQYYIQKNVKLKKHQRYVNMTK